MGQVGQTSLAVVPTMKGFRQKVNAESKAAARSAGRGMSNEFGRTGVQAGRAMGRGFRTGSVEAERALKDLTRSNAQATSAWSAANRRHENALGQVRVAQAKLTEATEKYGEGSVQAVTAQERLATAQRRTEETAVRLQNAQDRLSESTKALADAQKAAAGGGGVWAKLKKDLDPITSRVTALRDRFKETFATSKLGRGLTTMIDKTTLGLAKATLATYNFGDGLVKRVGGAASSAGQAVSGAFNGFLAQHQRLNTAFTKMGDSVRAVGRGFAAAGDMLGGVGRAAMTAGGAVGRALGPGLSATWNGLRTQISGAATAFTSMLGGAAVVAGGMIAGAMTKAFVGGFSRLSNIENAEAKMRGLGFSASDIEQAMDGASDAVDGTAFALDEMASAASMAMAAGVAPGKELNAYMTALKNTAAATGSPLNDIASIMGKVVTGGKAYTTEIQQIADRGLPIWKALQDEYGVTADEMRKMVSAGEVDAATFQRVMTEMTGNVADEMGGTTGAAIKNFGSALSKLGADMLQGLYPIIGPLFNALKAGAQMLQTLGAPAFEAMAAATAPLAEKLTAFAENWATVKDEIANGAEPIQAITGVFDQLGVSLQGPVSAISAIRDAFSSLGSAALPVIGGLVGALGPLLTRLPLVGGAFTGLTGPVGIFIGLLIAVWQQSEAFRDAVGAVFEGLVAALQPVFEALGPVLGTLGEVFGQVAAVIGDVLAAALMAIIPLFEPLGEILAVLVTALEPVLALFGPLAEILGNILVTALTALTPLFEFIGEILVMLSPIIEMVAGVVAQLLEALLPLLEPIGQLIGALLPPLIDLFTTVLGPIMELAGVILNALMPVVQALIDILSGLINFVVGVFSGNWDQAWQGIKQIFTGFKDGIVGIVNGIGDIFSGLIDTIMGIFGGIEGWLVDSGRALIEGFVNGIMAGFDWAGKKISEGIEWVKGFFPHSPAKRGPLSGGGWKKLRESGSAFADQWVGGAEDGLEEFSLPDLLDESTRSLTAAFPAGRNGAAAASAASRRVEINNEIKMYDRDPRIVAKQIGRGIEEELV